ncbi:hypothetical protein E2C01_082586 [Portunus trituberculatus]|uniref:Uncharacterized protein n=1 Tax=Portunus trituberculatus TaxID=210409 RepID=A0A5B7J5J1_PORTR|nr:hypothetical protein [Portunus trituberculatus]
MIIPANTATTTITTTTITTTTSTTTFIINMTVRSKLEKAGKKRGDFSFPFLVNHCRRAGREGWREHYLMAGQSIVGTETRRLKFVSQ